MTSPCSFPQQKKRPGTGRISPAWNSWVSPSPLRGKDVVKASAAKWKETWQKQTVVHVNNYLFIHFLFYIYIYTIIITISLIITFIISLIIIISLFIIEYYIIITISILICCWTSLDFFSCDCWEPQKNSCEGGDEPAKISYFSISWAKFSLFERIWSCKSCREGHSLSLGTPPKLPMKLKK